MSNNFPEVGPADGFPSGIIVKDSSGVKFLVLRLVSFSSSIFEFGVIDNSGGTLNYEFIKFTNNTNGSNHSSSSGLDATEASLDLEDFCTNLRVTY
jgi:hypothetical protein